MNSMSKSIKCQCISVCLSNNILVGEIKGVPLYCLCSRQHRKKIPCFIMIQSSIGLYMLSVCPSLWCYCLVVSYLRFMSVSIKRLLMSSDNIRVQQY